MKIDNGDNSSFRKLAAGRVEKNEDGSIGLQKSEKKSPEKGIEEAVKANSEAAATVTRVAEVASRSTDSADSKKEVEASNREASSAKVEDVERLAEAVASRIKDSPGKAFKAQANQATDKVFQLLQ